MSPTVDDSVVAFAWLLTSLLSVALYVWTALALSAMFRKMGEEPWKGWVPLLNVATVLKWGGFSPWLVLLSLLPIANIAVLVLLIISAHRINPGFGYGTGMTVLAAFVFVVWASILGFGPARWLGARAVRRPAPAGPAPAEDAAPAPVGRAMPEGAPPLASYATPRAEQLPPRPPAPPAPPAADAASFAPPASAGAPAWTPPDTIPKPPAAIAADLAALDAADAAETRAAAAAPYAAPSAGGLGAPAQGASTDARLAADARGSVGDGAASGLSPRAEPQAASAHRSADPQAARPLRTPDDPFAVGPPTVPVPMIFPTGDDADWPSEIDDVSAVHPSPFPPSSAGGRAPAVVPVADDSGPIASVPGRRSDGPPAPPPDAPVTRVPAAPRREAPADPGAATPAAASGPAVPGAASAAAASPAGGAPAAAASAQEPAGPPFRAAVPGDAASTPAAPADDDAPSAPLRARRSYDADDSFPEFSGEVSAVVGSPIAGSPRSAIAAVSAQHRRVEEGRRIDPQDVDDDDDAFEETVIARRSVRATWELVPAAGSPIPLTGPVAILGRRPSGDAAFPHAQLVAVPDQARTVSKTHARIELRGDAWIVTDLGSTNGVLVRTLMGDEVEVEQGGQLDAGERFFLGDEEFHLRRITA